VRAWHFLSANGPASIGEVSPEDGAVWRHDGPLVCGSSGLHASKRVIDALGYAPGPIICRVECGGKIVEDSDQLVCSERTIVWRANASEVLLHFSRLCALDVVAMWGPPEVVLRYLRTGNELLREAAWAAAKDASRSLPRGGSLTLASAAKEAAWIVERVATRDAVWSVQETAATAALCAAVSVAIKATVTEKIARWDSACVATRVKASTVAARDAQNHRLHRMLLILGRGQ